MKIRRFTVSSDICFEFKSKTQGISNGTKHNRLCPAILGLNCRLGIDEYTKFQPCKN